MLQSPFYSSYLLLGEALIIGGIIGPALDTEEETRKPTITLWLLGLIALAATITASASALWHFEIVSGAPLSWALIGLIFLCSFILFVYRWRQASIALIIGGTILCGTLDQRTRTLFRTPEALDYRTTYKTTLQVYSAIKTAVPDDHRILFGYDRDELSKQEIARQDFAIYTLRFGATLYKLNYWDSLISLRQWDLATLSWTMPDIPDWGLNNLRQSARPTSIVLFCIEKARCELGQNKLRNLGYRVRERARSAIVGGGYVPFEMVIIDVEPTDAPPLNSQPE